MRKSIIAVGIAALLGAGIALGFVLDSDSTPAQTTGVSQQPILDTNPQTILGAINLMKPDFDGDTSDAARQLHEQLNSAGYYYKVTYDDGTERINYDYMENDKVTTAEYSISAAGTSVDVSRYGLSTEDWGVWCKGSFNTSVIDDLAALRKKVDKAASKLHADSSCEYDKFTR